MEAIEIGEIIDIANIDAVFMHVVENMVERQKGLGEYPTLSPMVASLLNEALYQ